MQQWNKGLMHTMTAESEEGVDVQKDCRAGDCEENILVFDWAMGSGRILFSGWPALKQKRCLKHSSRKKEMKVQLLFRTN
jgi:hypothetical protein